MKPYRVTAILVGALYIVGTVAGVLSVVFTGSVVDAPDYLARAAASGNQVITGALLVLTMGLALALVPVVIYPILKEHNQTLALGYVVFRGALEAAAYVGITLSLLVLVGVGRQYAAAGAGDANAAYFQALGAVISGARDSMRSILEIVFPLGALMLYTVLYQAKLIPRWLSGWGLAGAILWLAAGLLGLFQRLAPLSPAQVALSLPIGLQEMVMAVWLIAKGFNPPAIAAGPERAEPAEARAGAARLSAAR